MHIFRSLFMLTVALSLLSSVSYAQQPSNSDEDAVKNVVTAFLYRMGTYDLEAIPELFAPNANIGALSRRDGDWRSATYTLDEFLARVGSSKDRIPYEEPVQQWTVHVDNGNLAFVLADAHVLREGRFRSHNLDYFILMKIDGDWKILSGAYTATPVESTAE